MRENTPLDTILAAKILGQSSSTASAVLYTAQNLTDPQKEQARTNIGAVSINDIGTVFTLKGGVATVADLPSTGNNVGDVYYVESVSAGYIWMTTETYPNGYWEELGETIDLSAYVLKPTVSSPSGSTVSITPADNTIYSCGTLTSLTIADPPATGAYSIVFTSGTTATVTTIPASIIFPEAFVAEANTRYEINVEDGYAVAVGWPVS